MRRNCPYCIPGVDNCTHEDHEERPTPQPPENLIAPTEENVRYWSTRVLDTLEEEKWNRSHLEAVIRELLEKDTEMSANDQARAVLADIFELTDGYADGAPDASQHDKMCSVIAGKCRPFVKP